MELGRGAQYRVVDCGDRRVKKFPLSESESQAVVQSWYSPGLAPEEELNAQYHQKGVQASADVQDLLQRYPNLSGVFGNPIFEQGGVYTQDKVTPLGIILQAEQANSTEIIDSYIDSIISLWHYGIAERVYNFTVNAGLSLTNSIVLFDFGEITTDRNKVERAIEQQRWLRSFSYRHDMPAALKPYYSQEMRERLTSKTLAAYWQKNIKP